ncbi:MAG: 2-hydroxymuconate tautomerase [Candidatus Angelobacter sp.]
MRFCLQCCDWPEAAISKPSEDFMPLIQVTMLKGRTLEQKRRLAARITDAMVEDAKAVKDAVVVTFIEITREDYASAGVLLADKK